MKKKAQMEIMGLVVIVILVVLGMLFVVRFVVLEKPSDVRKEFTRTQLASNTLHAIVNTKTYCHKMSFEQLLIDCAEHKDTGQRQVDCYTNPSCDYAAAEIEKILGYTLEDYEITNYNFTAEINNEHIFPSIAEGDCSGIRKLQPQYYSVNGKALKLYLMICQ